MQWPRVEGAYKLSLWKTRRPSSSRSGQSAAMAGANLASCWSRAVIVGNLSASQLRSFELAPDKGHESWSSQEVPVERWIFRVFLLSTRCLCSDVSSHVCEDLSELRFPALCSSDVASRRSVDRLVVDDVAVWKIVVGLIILEFLR